MCNPSASATGATSASTASAPSLGRTIIRMVKLPPRRAMEASPRLQRPSKSAWVTCATIPGRSSPTRVNMYHLLLTVYSSGFNRT